MTATIEEEEMSTIIPYDDEDMSSSASVIGGGGVGGVGGFGGQLPEHRDGWLLVRIHVPELNVSKCLQFPADRLVWDVKQQVLASLPKVYTHNTHNPSTYIYDA